MPRAAGVTRKLWDYGMLFEEVNARDLQ